MRGLGRELATPACEYLLAGGSVRQFSRQRRELDRVSGTRVDDGEARSGKYKMTPTLVPDGTFDKETVLRLLSEAAPAIDPPLVKTICTLIQRYPSG